jgi:alkylation response protein AidB-like acyl-CoA dehydrogenase
MDRAELARTLAAHPGLLDNPIGIGWAGPTLLAAGTDAQVERWLPGILDGTALWCQLFSEPQAGSDLASLRTRARLDGDHYVVTGHKIWTSMAERADWGIVLVRTDPDAPKRRGISYLVVDMSSAGVQARPIRDMTGGQHFCEVHLDEVPVPAWNRIGAEGEGWSLAAITLSNERNSLSHSDGVLWGMGPTTRDLFATTRFDTPVLRDRAAALYAQTVVLALLDGTSHTSVRKVLADVHGQQVMELKHSTLGANGLLADYSADRLGDAWRWGYLFSRALTIGGGTTQVQLDIIAERLLGMPRG